MRSWVALAALIVLGSVGARSADPAGSGKLYPVRGAMLYGVRTPRLKPFSRRSSNGPGAVICLYWKHARGLIQYDD